MGSGPLARESPLTLTDAELEDLTRKKRPSAQERALRFMGIEHRRRPDGTVAVLREHVVEEMGGKRSTRTPAKSRINWAD
jgi:hypothetical protein